MAWNQVRWTQAHQIASLMDVEETRLPAEGVAPHAHYQELRAGGDRLTAVSFLGHALPRFEALAWAARVLDEQAAALPLTRADRQALEHSLRWLGEPDDDNRRAAMEAAEAAGENAPERMLATGVFFSGGSISEPDLPPVMPPPELAGRFAAIAVAMAAARSEERDAVLDKALDLGERVAIDGAEALKT